MIQSQPEPNPHLLQSRHLAVLLISSISLSVSGCGIPALRSAQSIASQPSSYRWNNGLAFLRSKTDNDSTSPKVRQEETDRIDAEIRAIENGPADSSSAPQLDEQQSELNQKPILGKLASVVQTASFLSSAQDSGEQAVDSTTKGESQNLVDRQLDVAAPSGNDQQRALTIADLSDTEWGVDPYPLNASITTSTPQTAVNGSGQLPQSVFYNDPKLVALINLTLAGNRELKMLAEEIQIASNETYARSGEYRPFVSLGAGAGFDKAGLHTREGAVEDQLSVAPGRGFPEPLGDFLVAANLSWEIDIWHRLRNSQRAASMRYLGTTEGRNYIITRIVAEVAENYYELLSLDSRLQTLEATIKIQQESLMVAVGKKKAGRGTELAVQRFKAEVQKNQSEQALIQQEIVETENRINLLAGRYPQPVERASTDFIQLDLGTLSAGIPSELLLNRPDIREAEREVTAAGLDVEVARARFYPNLSLTAGLGWNAFSTGYLFRSPESLIYGMAAELVGPLINKRAIKADYCSANAAQLQAIYNYQQTVLEAHVEVVNQITKVENFRSSVELKKQQLESLEASVTAASRLFQNARAEYVEVLLAQREMMEARMTLIDTKREQLEAIVNAYQALGGGRF
ncbi:MAG: TolC family protein [Fuerstiella sp.]